MLPALLRPAAALRGAGADKIALHVGQAAEYGQHQAALRRSGVGPSVVERAEAGPPFPVIAARVLRRSRSEVSGRAR